MPVVSTKQKAAFLEWATPLAVEASRETGVRWQVVVAQWCHETGFGTSQLFLEHRNLAGIKNASAKAFRGPTVPGSSFRHYDTVAQALDDWVRVMRLAPYDAVRVPLVLGNVDDPAQHLLAQIAALGASPWDAGHYRGAKKTNAPGTALLAYLPVIASLGPLGALPVEVLAVV